MRLAGVWVCVQTQVWGLVLGSSFALGLDSGSSQRLDSVSGSVLGPVWGLGWVWVAL